MGLVQVNGAIELNQFFPAGRSDADTTNVRVRVDPTSFRYVEALGAAPICRHRLKTDPLSPAED